MASESKKRGFGTIEDNRRGDDGGSVQQLKSPRTAIASNSAGASLAVTKAPAVAAPNSKAVQQNNRQEEEDDDDDEEEEEEKGQGCQEVSGAGALQKGQQQPSKNTLRKRQMRKEQEEIRKRIDPEGKLSTKAFKVLLTVSG